ncbi:hypothetical protein POSPLADRAFT_1066760 [Postia placenta MAD-698-R-SB12]|uniref:Cell wall protein n=1 Tax=Postia placenta MAD-698-R-SB12 TaxID=670580 RepID=A0A1X6MVY7_9APHY|nr:hypothetical protein POSPLADRAFT_1066760 [Postia placenta MAD-698-R-SB12]OSX60509.1 hypothetical protein POSPLADRAFT_1066760 [Postia placenta MAD-698-R-SB12]
MRSVLSILALASPLLVQSAPVRRVANSTDVKIFQFAGALEQLANTFYEQALSKFQASDFLEAGYSDVSVPLQQIQAMWSNEATQLSVINSTLESLGASPITGCQFDLTDALANVSSMASAARVMENLGTSAYLGAVSMISDPSLLTAAASMMSVKARQQTVLNVLNQGSAVPQAFDIALNPSQVLAVAGSFISGCQMPFTANAALSVTNTAPAQPGTVLSFASAALNGSTSTTNFACQMLFGGAAFSISQPLNNCVVPSGINGPVAVFVTSDDQPIDANIREQNDNTLVAGPAMVFVDTMSDALAQAAKGSVSSSSNSTSSGSSSGSGSSTSNSTSSGTSASSDSAATSTAITVSSSALSSSVASASSTLASSSTVLSSSIASASAVTSSLISSASASTSVVATATASAASTAVASATDTQSSAVTTIISPSQASAILSVASAEAASATVTAGVASSAVASASA